MFAQLSLLNPKVKRYYVLQIEFWSGHKSYRNGHNSQWNDEEVAYQYKDKKIALKDFDKYNSPYYLNDSMGRPQSKLRVITRFGILNTNGRYIPIKHKVNQNI